MRRRGAAWLAAMTLAASLAFAGDVVTGGAVTRPVVTEEGTTVEAQVPQNVLGGDLRAADAGNCSAPGVCGRLFNRSYSVGIWVARDWTGSGPGSVQGDVNPRYRSTVDPGYADTDAVYVGSGWCIYQQHPTGEYMGVIRTAGWHKITDTTFDRHMTPEPLGGGGYC